MRSLLVMNQKGGVGKTTLVVNLAQHFVRFGKKVAVIDLDVQGNTSFTLSQADSGVKASGLFIQPEALAKFSASDQLTLFSGDSRLLDIDSQSGGLPELAEQFRTNLEKIAQSGYDFCLMDSPAALGVRSYSALLTADAVLAPIELEAYSIQGIKLLLATVINAREQNKKLRFLGMAANKVDRRNPRHIEHLRQLKEAYGRHVLPACVGLRASIAEALVTGEPIWSSRKTAARAAKKELETLSRLVLEKMEEA